MSLINYRVLNELHMTVIIVLKESERSIQSGIQVLLLSIYVLLMSLPKTNYLSVFVSLLLRMSQPLFFLSFSKSGTDLCKNI